MIRAPNTVKRNTTAIEKPENIHKISERPETERSLEGIAETRLPTGGKKQMVQDHGRKIPTAGLCRNTPGVSRIAEMKYSLKISRTVKMKGL